MDYRDYTKYITCTQKQQSQFPDVCPTSVICVFFLFHWLLQFVCFFSLSKPFAHFSTRLISKLLKNNLLISVSILNLDKIKQFVINCKTNCFNSESNNKESLLRLDFGTAISIMTTSNYIKIIIKKY
ncbi:hypothetical protein RND81_14G078700 [Saponaria officinalis]|uniref:Uncharacterized protein n=1 Tax=Saponaria officinalis TaxID=3572 RepID=A0AAW1GN50_SAPOF